MLYRGLLDAEWCLQFRSTENRIRVFLICIFRSHYARDRTRGRRLALEHAVKMQTSDTAGVVGLHDRGRLEVR